MKKNIWRRNEEAENNESILFKKNYNVGEYLQMLDSIPHSHSYFQFQRKKFQICSFVSDA